jgi:hypothetical protein
MPEPIVFPLDLDEVREIWITRDVYGRLCGESRLFSQSDIGEALEGLRRARGDIQSLVAEVDRLQGLSVDKARARDLLATMRRACERGDFDTVAMAIGQIGAHVQEATS